MKNDIYPRIIALIFMSIFLLGIFITALLPLDLYYDEVRHLHKYFALFFTLFLTLHIYLRREKLSTMFKEFYTLLTVKEQNQNEKCNKLIKTLKQRSLEEICIHLNLDMQKAISVLNEKHITLKSLQESLGSISKENDYDALKISAMLIENQIRTNQKKQI